MSDATDLSKLPEGRILARMERHLRARREFPVGSLPWAEAVAGYEACSAELDRRTREQIVDAVRKINADLGLPDTDL